METNFHCPAHKRFLTKVLLNQIDLSLHCYIWLRVVWNVRKLIYFTSTHFSEPL